MHFIKIIKKFNVIFNKHFPNYANRLCYFYTARAPISMKPELYTASMPKGDVVNVTFILPDKRKVTVQGKEGDNLLHLANSHNVPIHGPCKGKLSCKGCYVSMPEKFYNKLPEPSDKEKDALDSVPDLKDFSRFSCQVKLTKDLEGIVITVPDFTKRPPKKK